MRSNDIFFFISAFPVESLHKVARSLTVKINGTQRFILFQLFKIDHIWIEVKRQLRDYHS